MKIYFLHTGLISFVRKDLDILSGTHEVRPDLNHGRAIRNIFCNLRGILWSDMVFCWFASIHFLPAVLLARLLHRRVVVVAGGYDVVNLPQIDYGNMRGGVKSALVRLLLRLADRVISISESNQLEALENAGVDPARNIMIYHGFSAPSTPEVAKEPMVVTVGEVSWSNLKRKGLEDFVRLGAFFPEVSFRLIGKWSDDSHTFLEGIATPNVKIMGFVDHDTFHDILGRAKVYLQPSRHEGFGCSVAEAMLLGCIPVVSNAFALPEVIGDCGFLAAPGNMEEFREALTKALAADESLRMAARDRILKTFPLDIREKRLLEEVASV